MDDVLIVGGGIIGCSIALALAERGVSARVLERGATGAEASWAAAGMLAPQLEAEGPGPALSLGLESRARYPAWIAGLEGASSVSTGFARCGAVEWAPDAASLAHAVARAERQRTLGLRAEPLDAQALSAALPGIATAAGGIWFPDEAQVDPRALMQALTRAAEAAGVTITRGAEVKRLLVRGDRARGVALADEEIEAAAVVIAAGAWSGELGLALTNGAVRPARGQMLALDAGRPPFTPLVWAPGGYLVPRASGRVLVGATMELVGFEKAVTAAGVHHLLGVAMALMPGLASAPLVQTWSGLRPYADAPLIGATPVEGLFLATGHHRNGILLAPATAEALAELITEGHSALDLTAFSPLRAWAQA